MKRNPEKANKLKNRQILLIVTGSIAAYRSPDIVKALRQDGAGVTCIMTRSSQQFVTPMTLRAVSGSRVYSDFFELDTPYDVLHTSLADSADLIIVAPASANFMARLAGGMADDLATCTILAARAPVLIVPAMNDNMYNHVLTRRNKEMLQSAGYRIVEPVEGDLVCGRTAVGHIVETQTILENAVSALEGRKA